jgi:glycosyltransferase involved in cell wall biosynthesis
VFDLEPASALPGSAVMSALLRAADIYCQPNTAPDAFGASFVEAMHAAVVTSGIGGALEIVDRDCGCLLRPATRCGHRRCALIVDGGARAMGCSALRPRSSAILARKCGGCSGAAIHHRQRSRWPRWRAEPGVDAASLRIAV